MTLKENKTTMLHSMILNDLFIFNHSWKMKEVFGFRISPEKVEANRGDLG